MVARRTTDEALVVSGVNAVLGLLRSGHPDVHVYTAKGPPPEPLATALAERGVSVSVIGPAEMDRLTRGARHQGVAAKAERFEYVSIEDAVRAPGRGAIVLDGILDPRNLGAIARSARAAGVRGLMLPRDRSASVTAAVVTASAGTIFGLPVARVPNVARALGLLKDAGMWTVGLAPRADRFIDRLPTIPEPALVVGAEGGGLRRLVRERCDFVAGIPMAGPVESLNASVAAGIALYELLLRHGNVV
jgi:23S rRNA (guanosine2251-2'-O)-methyltransferase